MYLLSNCTEYRPNKNIQRHCTAICTAENLLAERKAVTLSLFHQGLEKGVGSWTRIPDPFSRESRIPHFFHYFPESRFSFPEKYV